VSGDLIWVAGSSDTEAFDRGCFGCGPLFAAGATGAHELLPVVADGIAYITDQDNGVQVYDLPAPLRPAAVTRTSIEGLPPPAPRP
jgi:hypothetical protein